MARPSDVTARLRRVRLLVCDVDGVLTDGTIVVDDLGRETKFFSVLDGTGFVLARLAGLRNAWLSGRKSKVVEHRARECRIDFVEQGLALKVPVFERVCRSAGVTEAEAAYIGDDLIDLPVLKRAGLAVAVSNAGAEVKRQAHWVTRTPGGRGAVRELVERILRAQGCWDEVLQRYLERHVAKN